MAEVQIKGMTCKHCVASVKEALEKLSAVSNVVVDLERGLATYEGDVAVSDVVQAIEAIGFEVV